MVSMAIRRFTEKVSAQVIFKLRYNKYQIKKADLNSFSHLKYINVRHARIVFIQ